MRPQGGRLSGAERRAVAEYLSGRALGGDITGARIGRCTIVSAAARSRRRRPRGTAGRRPPPTRRFQSAQQAGLTAEQVPRLSLKWAFGFPDATSAWSQPTVAERPRVRRQPERHRLLARREERLHLLDVHREERRAHGVVVRAAATGASGYAVYFGDTGANVYALDAATGRELWSRRLDEHPATRASPDRRRSIRIACTSRCRRSRKPRRASRATSAARSAAA